MINKHSAIPKTGDAATVLDLPEHGIETALFNAFASEGHIPKRPIEAVEIAFVLDAIHAGGHAVNAHKAHHPAGIIPAYPEEAVHGEATFEHTHELIIEGDAPEGRPGEIHEITLVYDAIHMVNTMNGAP